MWEPRSDEFHNTTSDVAEDLRKQQIFQHFPAAVLVWAKKHKYH